MCVWGVSGFFDTGDVGFVKDGRLYLEGRSDDVINIHGEKINKTKIEEILLGVEGIEECLVCFEEDRGRKILTAHLAGNNLPEKISEKVFEEISPVFIPKRYIRHEKLLRNESSKISYEQTLL